MAKNITELTHKRLKDWGKWWYRMLTSPAVGYPPESIEGKLMSGGGLLVKGMVDLHIPINLDADEIDVLVGELLTNKKERQGGIVLRVNYILRGRQEHKAKLLKMSSVQYQYHLKAARMYIAGRLKSEGKRNRA